MLNTFPPGAEVEDIVVELLIFALFIAAIKLMVEFGGEVDNNPAKLTLF